MSTTITAKLNKTARSYPGAKGHTFFVSLGEQTYDHKTKQKVWTNYEAALFANERQVQFYADKLVAGAVVAVTGSAIIVRSDDPAFPPKLELQDAKLTFVHSATGAPAQQSQAASPYQQAPQYQQAPPMSAEDVSEDIPF